MNGKFINSLSAWHMNFNDRQVCTNIENTMSMYMNNQFDTLHLVLNRVFCSMDILCRKAQYIEKRL